MNRGDDEFGDMNEAPFAWPAPLGHGGSDAEVATFLAALRSLGEGAAPEPSPEVVTLLGGARPWRRRAVRIVARSAVAAAAAVAAAVVAAANHDLPSPAQHVVSNVVNVLTPFHIGPPTPAVPPPSHQRPVQGNEPGESPERDESGGSESEPEVQPPQSGAPSRSDESSSSPEPRRDDGGASGPVNGPTGRDDGGGSGSTDEPTGRDEGGGTGQDR